MYPAQGLRYRTDGYNWARKSGGRLKESNSALRVDGNEVLATYTRDQSQVRRWPHSRCHFPPAVCLFHRPEP